MIAVALILAALPSFWDDDGVPADVVLRIGALDKVDSMNPYVGIERMAQLFHSLVYDCLQSVDENLEVTPNLALSWNPVPVSDPRMQLTGEPFGSVWQYNLTENALWHDGIPFTAQDVVYTFNLNAGNHSSLSRYLPSSHFVRSAEAIDNYTVRIHFYDRATGHSLPVAFANMTGIHILPKHLMEGMDAFAIGFNWTGTFPDQVLPLVGTGPFKVTQNIRDEWSEGDHVTLVRNERYHSKADRGEEVHFDKLILYFYDDSTAMRYALENRQLDVARLPPEAFAAIEQDIEQGDASYMTAFSGPTPSEDLIYLSWLMTSGGPNPARLDPEVRSALALATNQSYIVEHILGGYADEATTIISSANRLWHYEPELDELMAFDAEEANSALENAGYVDTDLDGIRECTSSSYANQSGLVPAGTELRVSLVTWVDLPGGHEIADYLKEAWTNVGVGTVVKLYDSRIGPTLCPVEEDVAIVEWRSSPEPNGILYGQSSAALGGWSDSRYRSTEYDENYSLSVSSMTFAARKEAILNCQRIHYLDLPYQNLAYNHQLYAWRTDNFVGWGDWSEHPGMSLDNVWGANPLLVTLVPISECDKCMDPWLLLYTTSIATGVAGLGLLGLGLRRRSLLRKELSANEAGQKP